MKNLLLLYLILIVKMASAQSDWVLVFESSDKTCAGTKKISLDCLFYINPKSIKKSDAGIIIFDVKEVPVPDKIYEERERWINLSPEKPDYRFKNFAYVKSTKGVNCNRYSIGLITNKFYATNGDIIQTVSEKGGWGWHSIDYGLADEYKGINEYENRDNALFGFVCQYAEEHNLK